MKFISGFSIQGVRGILERSESQKLFDKRQPKSLAIFAPNGHGKSGYADAFEYFFSDDGEVEHLGKGSSDAEKGGKPSLIHVLAENRQPLPLPCYGAT